MTAGASGTPARRTVRVYRFGKEPRDALRETTTAQQRLLILRQLTERALDLDVWIEPTR